MTIEHCPLPRKTTPPPAGRPPRADRGRIRHRPGRLAPRPSVLGERQRPAPEPATTPSPVIRVVTLATSAIEANGYNPNEMTEEAFAAFREEVRRLGRLPKPVVVREAGDRFVLIDGEHALRAARDLCHAEVAAEVLEVDDFEALRQSHARNRHGKRNPLKQGRLYQLMIATTGMAQRELARELGVADGTVRNFLRYPEAAALRIRCAAGEADAQIAGLKVAQVRKYLETPDESRDAWLDRELSGEADPPAQAMGESTDESAGPPPDESASAKAADSGAGAEVGAPPPAAAAGPAFDEMLESLSAAAHRVARRLGELPEIMAGLSEGDRDRLAEPLARLRDAATRMLADLGRAGPAPASDE